LQLHLEEHVKLYPVV